MRLINEIATIDIVMDVIPIEVFRSAQPPSADTRRACVMTYEPYSNISLGKLGYHDYGLVSADSFDSIIFVFLQFKNGVWSPYIDENGMYIYVHCITTETKWNNRDNSYKFNAFKHTYYQFYPTQVDNAIKDIMEFGLDMVTIPLEEYD